MWEVLRGELISTVKSLQKQGAGRNRPMETRAWFCGYCETARTWQESIEKHVRKW